MSQKGQKCTDLITQHTDNSSIAQRQQPQQALPQYVAQCPQPSFLNKIIQSSQQIINSQAMQIFELNNQIKILKKQNQLLKNKYETLIRSCSGNALLDLDQLLGKVNQLEGELVAAKLELAECKAVNLELKFAGQKNNKNVQMSTIIQSIKYPQITKLQSLLKCPQKPKSLLEQSTLTLATSQWLKLIDSYLSGFPRLQRFKEKSLELVRKGIPHELRQSLWPIIFENRIGISNVLYGELLGKRGRDQGYIARVSAQIGKDICRSFNGKTQFDSKVGLWAEVCEILEIFHLFRPDISYVQGMTYPVIVLNLIVGKYKAFCIFSNLVTCNQFFRRLYTFEPHYLSCYCRAFDILLQQKLPKVSKFLAQKGIQSQIFLVQWFYTFFSRGFSYQLTLKMWDMFAYQQQLLFYKLGLSILQLIQTKLLQPQVEQPISIIREFSSYLAQIKLQQVLLTQKLTSQKLEKTFEKVFKKQGQSKSQ